MSETRKRIIVVIAILAVVIAVILVALLSGSGEMATGYQDAVRQRQRIAE